MASEDQAAALPSFRYFPDPIGCGSFLRAQPGERVVCPCCDRETRWYYASRMYTVEDVERVCPACLASGAAAEKYDGEFVQDSEPVSDPLRREELHRRTPGYVSWQGENWLAHCDDYMAYLGGVGTAELTTMGIADEVLGEYETHGYYDADELRPFLTAGGSMAGYLFRCLHCGTYRIWVDAD